MSCHRFGIRNPPIVAVSECWSELRSRCVAVGLAYGAYGFESRSRRIRLRWCQVGSETEVAL